jgi:hypothetical protein
MITTRPCRSTKCAGEMVNPPIGCRYGVAIWSANAADHSPYRHPPGAKPPATTRLALVRFSQARPPTSARTAPGPPDSTNSPLWTAFTAKYAMPKNHPDAPNASGIASAITRYPPMPTSRMPRRRLLVGATALVSQAYPPYIQKITPSMSATRPTPTRSSRFARTAVSWVTVKTKTRSKKSSRVETRTAGSTDPAGSTGPARSPTVTPRAYRASDAARGT